MATAAFRAPSTGACIMQSSRPKPRNHSPEELKEIVRKIHALRRLKKVTGYFTSHEIVELLSELSTDDLVAIGEELKLKPNELPLEPIDNKRQQPIYNRNK
jgi:hypothetical protein